MKVQFNDYSPINREIKKEREPDRQTEKESLDVAEKSASSGLASLNGAKRIEDSSLGNLLLAYDRYSPTGERNYLIQTSIKRHRLPGGGDNRTAAAPMVLVVRT